MFYRPSPSRFLIGMLIGGAVGGAVGAGTLIVTDKKKIAAVKRTANRMIRSVSDTVSGLF